MSETKVTFKICVKDENIQQSQKLTTPKAILSKVNWLWIPLNYTYSALQGFLVGVGSNFSQIFQNRRLGHSVVFLATFLQNFRLGQIFYGRVKWSFLEIVGSPNHA